MHYIVAYKCCSFLLTCCCATSKQNVSCAGPVVGIYYSSQFAPLVVFFLLFLSVVKNTKLHHFVRFNAMQVSSLHKAHQERPKQQLVNAESVLISTSGLSSAASPHLTCCMLTWCCVHSCGHCKHVEQNDDGLCCYCPFKASSVCRLVHGCVLYSLA